jgi:hypothetical protein
LSFITGGEKAAPAVQDGSGWGRAQDVGPSLRLCPHRPDRDDGDQGLEPVVQGWVWLVEAGEVRGRGELREKGQAPYCLFLSFFCSFVFSKCSTFSSPSLQVAAGNPMAIAGGLGAIKSVYDGYKSKDDKDFNTFISQPFLTSEESDKLINQLRTGKFFEKMVRERHKRIFKLEKISTGELRQGISSLSVSTFSLLSIPCINSQPNPPHSPICIKFFIFFFSRSTMLSLGTGCAWALWPMTSWPSGRRRKKRSRKQNRT